METDTTRESTLSHMLTGALYTIVSVVLLGLLYPAVMWLLATVIFPFQANGSTIVQSGKPIGSAIIGQLWTKPQYFHGRPSAAGKNGYDPTSTGGTNLGPTSKKLMEATKATIAALQKENPNAPIPVPMDLVTSSASGIDPDISPEGAYYQASRVAAARHMPVEAVNAIIARATEGRTFGFLGEPHVNVLKLNLMLEDRP